MIYNIPEGFELKPEHKAVLDFLIKKHELTVDAVNDFIHLHCQVMEDQRKNYQPCE